MKEMEWPKDEGYGTLSRPVTGLEIEDGLAHSTQESHTSESASTMRKPSRNSIFEMTLAVDKPTTKMTDEEIQALKQGKSTHSSVRPAPKESTFFPVLSITSSKSSEEYPVHGEDASKSSITVPIQSPLQRNIRVSAAGLGEPMADLSLTTLKHFNTCPDDDHPAFLLTSSNQIELSTTLASPSAGALENLPPLKHSKKVPSLSIAKGEYSELIDYKDSLALDNDRVQVWYMPTSKNLLGEGRYAQVYLGEISLNSLNISPILSPENYSTRSQLLPSPLTAVDSPTEARQRDSLIPCAIKRVHFTLEAQMAGETEAVILQKISPYHQNIVKLLAVVDEALVDCQDVSLTKSRSQISEDEPTTKLLILLEYLSQGNMWSWMRKHSIHLGRKLFIKWAKQLASAVAYIHSVGLVHHDIKPHNILLTDLLDPRLADFGNACYVPDFHAQDSPSILYSPLSDKTLSPGSEPERTLRNPQSTQSLKGGIGRGTLAYTAPELIANQPYSFPIDVYSLGVTLFVLITGKEPFSLSKTNIQMMMGIKRGFFESGMQEEWNGRFLSGELVDNKILDLIKRMVERDPVNRPTAREFHMELEQIDV